MTKEIIAYPELLEKIQIIVSSSAECHDIHIDAIDVQTEEVDGAN